MINLDHFDYSPAGWRLEPKSSIADDHIFEANRCRNIVDAIDNLITQLGMECETDSLARTLESAKEIYQCELQRHEREANLPSLFGGTF